jgi:ABC-2 type transport system permease protein
MQTDSARPSRAIDAPLRPVGRPSGFWEGTKASVVEVWAHRQLLGRLVRRELRAKYKGSSLGIAWSLFRPLVQLVIYYVAIGQFLSAARSIPDFAIFVFTGLTIWGLYSEIVSAGTGSILNNSGLVKKVYLPREIFPLAAVGGSLFNFVIQFVILITATLVLGSPPLHAELALLPLAVLLTLVFGTAITFVTAAVNVYLRDVGHLVEVLLLVLFWTSPIVYSMGLVHQAIGGTWLEELYLANPVTLAVVGMQKAIWVAGSTDPTQYWPPNLELRLAVALLVSLILLWIGQRIFARMQGNFAQEL